MSDTTTDNSSSSIILRCKNITRTFIETEIPVKVFENISFQVQQGESLAITGASGSGKSSLLYVLGGLDKPDSGTVYWKGRDIHSLNEKQRSHLRNSSLGFVYQFHHLLPEFTALENVAMPLWISGIKSASALDKAKALLVAVGLEKRCQHKPGEISGGERQRVAIARALVNEPDCLLADEPTGNLDNYTAEQVYDLMLSLNQRLKTSLIMVTHDTYLSSKMERILHLEKAHLKHSLQHKG